MYRRIIFILLLLVAIPCASAEFEFDFTSALVVPDYTANDTLYIVPYEQVNATIGIEYPGGNVSYNITHDSNTGYFNNSSGVVRVYSDEPIAVYHVSENGITYLDNSLSYTIDIQHDVHTTVSIIDYINEVIFMIGYVLFLAVLLHFGRNTTILQFAAAVLALWRVFAVFPDDQILGSVWILIMGGVLVSIVTKMVESNKKKSKR